MDSEAARRDTAALNRARNPPPSRPARRWQNTEPLAKHRAAAALVAHEASLETRIPQEVAAALAALAQQEAATEPLAKHRAAAALPACEASLEARILQEAAQQRRAAA